MNTIKNLSKIAFIYCLLTTSFGVYSQKIETESYKGKEYFVYPFKMSVQNKQAYFNSIISSKKHLNTIIDMLKKDIWKDLTPEQYAQSVKLFKNQIKSFRKLSKKDKSPQQHQLAKAIRENPYPLLDQEYERDVDIQPCLDAIPDGMYIQYFYDFALIDHQNQLNLETKRVAGIFEIKNNVLNGNAIWFNFKGDTLKKGVFKNGLKEGEWYFEKREIENRLTKEMIQDYIHKGAPYIDTIIEKMEYHKGVRNGFYTQNGNVDFPFYEGAYLNNEPAGNWKERLLFTSNFILGDQAKEEELKKLKNNSLITATYTFPKEKKIVKQPIIRNELITDEYDENFNFNYEYEPYDVNKDLFEIAFTEEPNLELDEENSNSYEGEEYNEEYYDEGEGGEYSHYDYEEGESNFQYTVYDQKNEKDVNRGRAIDSLGLKFNYDGIYERHYTNGQLMFRYEFKDGKLQKEDTIFWDNGNPYDVVNFQKDSNQYIQYVYDYDGKLYNEIVFDSKGDFVRVNFEPNYTKYHFIEGVIAKETEGSTFLSYDKMDTLAFKLDADSVLIWKSWNLDDSTKLFERTYFPKDRILKFSNYSMSGKTTLKGELTFNEDFKSWTGEESFSFQNLTLKSQKSASFFNQYYNESITTDTIPQLNVNEYDQIFDVTTDNILFKDGKPFSGPFSLKFNMEKPAFKIGKSIQIDLPIAELYQGKLYKDYERFKKTGKSKYPGYINTIDYSEILDDHSSLIFNSLTPFLGSLVIYPEVYLDEETNKYDEMKEDPTAKLIVGNYREGKPDGLWTIKDQFGEIQSEIPFTKGEINGVSKTYSTAYPVNEEEEYSETENKYAADTFPKKKLNYLSYVENYKNGMVHGESVRYNWLGEVELKQNYVEGWKQGPSFERNNYAITKMNYLDDALDGYMQTYLTIKGQDSILLYDLNFQNGMLQGESKSYHTNGELSKRGFFLNGQSIDDYEAFDSLGFKYHYVKFLYSFPIEEKIWEENELSVRYTFDWRDSIYFSPSDITSSESLEEMLADLGIGDVDGEYYGRPSLVEKTGIDYHMTKYYPNDTIARDGEISAGKKVGCWKYFNYYGVLLNEVDYQDSIITLNDSIQFKSKGIITDYNEKGKPIRKSFIIEKFEKYDCSHTDHYEIRQLYTTWQANDTMKFKNGYVKNHYDNGVLQNEGRMENGLPTGVWKFYDPFGKLNQVGVYVMGKRDGRWLAGDLSKTKYLGDICLNPNLPDLEEEIKKRESQLDIVITNYQLGKALNKEFFDINWSEIEKK